MRPGPHPNDDEEVTVPDWHSTMLEDLRHCPQLDGNPRERAYQGDRDALRIADDVRQLDPRQVWGAINRLGKADPQCLLAALISLAVRVARLADSGLPDHEIARRLGIPQAHVTRARLAAGIRKPTTPGPRRDGESAS